MNSEDDSENIKLTIELLRKRLEFLEKENVALKKENESLVQETMSLKGIKAQIEKDKKSALKTKYDSRSKLTWEIIFDICGLLLKGLNLQESSEHLGLNFSTVRSWKLRGKNADKTNIYKAFYNAINKSLNTKELTYLTRLEEASKNGNVAVTEKLLKVVKPEKYSVWTTGKHFKEEEERVEEIIEYSNENIDNVVNDEIADKLVAKFSRIITSKTKTIDIFDEEISETEDLFLE